MPEPRDLSYLRILLGREEEELEELRQLTAQYHTVEVPKRRGGFRTIAIPPDDLKAFQRDVLKFLLRDFRIDGAVHGAVRGRNTKTHAAEHEYAQAAYILDFANAFGHVTRPMVEKVWRRCLFDGDEVSYLTDIVMCNGSLPQGAPTSNAIWNLVCEDLDTVLGRFAADHWLVYTRYVDELVFSHPRHLSQELRRAIRCTVRDAGFVLNPRKSRYCHVRNGALPITGISVSDGRLRLAKRRRERLRAFLHRAARDSTISRERVEGRLGEVRLVYGELPPRLRRPYEQFLETRSASAL
ncbi:RNA-directed DNA polymerase [Candidatus Uhrbacteria bacterium]|nr:RNA-directed DNA polymerase [Candidatus Uhrbacteria bacterium]